MTQPPACVIVYPVGDGVRHQHAEQLAAQLQLPCQSTDSVVLADFPLQLNVTVDGLSLGETAKGSPGPVRVDFVAGKLNYRRQHGGGFGEMVAKAVGVKASKPLSVLDCTAGLGRDAYILAALGCEVTLLERSPLVAAILADGLSRAEQEVEIADIIGRMHLQHTDAMSYLQAFDHAQGEQPDVVYLDPMFPERNKSAQVKKEMRLFHTLVGADSDATELLPLALQVARKRVVVKRPRLAPLLHPDIVCHHSLQGKANRFDIYSPTGA